jgi:hypothetical protein
MWEIPLFFSLAGVAVREIVANNVRSIYCQTSSLLLGYPSRAVGNAALLHNWSHNSDPL